MLAEVTRSPARAGARCRALVLCAQGGLAEADFNAAIGGALSRDGSADVSVVCLRRADRDRVRRLASNIDVVQSFEEFQGSDRVDDLEAEMLRITGDYTDVNWWEIAAAERSFIDSSFLVGGLGAREETRDYVERLIVGLVRHLEATFHAGNYSAAVCQVADSLMIHVFYQVARRFGVEILALSPNAWIREDGRPAFYVARDEFMHNSRMEAVYRELVVRGLTEEERQRSQRFQRTVTDFNIVKSFQTLAKRKYIVPAVSPNLARLGQYLSENAARQKVVEYYKIDARAKLKANILRQWRRIRSRGRLGSAELDIAPRSVFFPMQYQPEQTTLVGGIYYANQVSTIENIAKALPFGSELIIKEHPRGRGARPVWQYQHLAHFPNVRFCDADSKEIMKRCDAVVTITSTVGLEAMALDRPLFLLGQCYYDFADVIYRPKSWPELATMFKRVLIARDYEQRAGRRDLIDSFFLAYLTARVPGTLNTESVDAIAAAVFSELEARNASRSSGGPTARTLQTE